MDGAAFDLTSIWFYLDGKAADLTNAFQVFDTNNTSHSFDFTQATFAANTGFTAILDFTGVTSITFARPAQAPVKIRVTPGMT